eukprot:TRINITY_DN91_c0_g1_i1.p1 TRINITY_DN91_c0_g1~~TRINITY_DN91_c0_g1_i1.p1  ORF type:complete len:194 (-),score=35.52 TRINITY_DN91_c0_g1_i1:314-895(-)
MFQPKRYLSFVPPFALRLGILPPGFRVNPAWHGLIRNPAAGVPKEFLAEAKRQGKYKELVVDMPVTDVRHPYFTEYLWTTYANADFELLTPEQKYQAWFAKHWRFQGGWQRIGMLYEDGFTQEEMWVVREAFERMPAEVICARQKRMNAALEMWQHGVMLSSPEMPSSTQDVAYLSPYIRQLLDEWHEVRSMV